MCFLAFGTMIHLQPRPLAECQPPPLGNPPSIRPPRTTRERREEKTGVGQKEGSSGLAVSVYPNELWTMQSFLREFSLDPQIEDAAVDGANGARKLRIDKALQHFVLREDWTFAKRRHSLSEQHGEATRVGLGNSNNEEK